MIGLAVFIIFQVFSQELQFVEHFSLDNLVLLGLLLQFVAKDEPYLVPVFIKIFLEKRDDLVEKYLSQLLESFNSHKIGMADHVIPVKQEFDPFIHCIEKLLKIDAID